MIRIRNVFYMLAYAFQTLNEEEFTHLGNEDFDYVNDLFAAILAKGIGNQIRRGLGKNYRLKSETLNQPVGKIDVATSIKSNSFQRKELACLFDEFTVNENLNQILKCTVKLLLKSRDVSVNNRRSLKRILFFFDEVDDVLPWNIDWSNLRYHRNNQTYRMLISICKLVIDGKLLNESEGSVQFSGFIDDKNMSLLFERFVLEFYRKHHSELNPSRSEINWAVDDDNLLFLPSMKSDITLYHEDRIIIIDTKYYGKSMQVYDRFNSKKVHSGNLYQLFTYVKNKAALHEEKVTGVLLYAKTDEEITPDYHYHLSGNPIFVKTLDLDQDFSRIREGLEKLLETILCNPTTSGANIFTSNPYN